MNLASALFKRILEEEDFDTWSSLRKHYLPVEYGVIYEVISKHVDLYHKLPSLEELKLSPIDETTLEKIYAIELVDVDAEPFLLLDYLKNEFAQKETLGHLQKYVDQSISFETAEETVNSLYEIIAKVEDKVELTNPDEDMHKLSLFDSEEHISSYIKLGLNNEFDDQVRFKSIDYIMFGGKRGSGKSLVCCNLANQMYLQNKSVLYFTIEMSSREIMQRMAAIGSGVPHSKIKYKELDNLEWKLLVDWWANRFENGDIHKESYLEHRDFDRFHQALIKESLKEAQIDIVYDPSLTLPKLKMEVIKRVKRLGNVGLVVVDYLNQIKRAGASEDMYDWKEQINVSKSIKSLAQEVEVPFVSPYQIDASGEARFSKGILDSADAAFTLTPGPDSMEFACAKMRGDAEISFTSKVEWKNLRIGPENGSPIEVVSKKKSKDTIGNSATMEGIYDIGPGTSTEEESPF